MMAPLKLILALNPYIGMNVWQMVESESLLQSVCVKTNCYYILYTNIPIKNIFWLTQAPNTSKHITNNKGTTMKTSRKKIHDKV